MKKNNEINTPASLAPNPFSLTFFYGTKAPLKMGDLIETGIASNYGQKTKAKIYLSYCHVKCSHLGR